MRIPSIILSGLILVGAGCASAPALSPDRATDGAANAPAAVAAPRGRSLDLRGRGLTAVPADVFSRTDLESLDVSDNALTGALPSELGRLTRLKTLDASGNAMTGLPAEIGRLKDLEVLDLSDNKLTGLPLELGDLPRLKLLDLTGNPYSTYDLDRISAKLPNTEIRK